MYIWLNYLCLLLLCVTLPAESRLGRMSKKSFKVLVTHPEVPKEVLDMMMEKVELVMCNSVPPNRTEILEKAKGVHGMFWANHEPLNAEALDAAGPQLKAVSTMSAGMDYVDIDVFKARKIPLGYTPTVLNSAVADIAIGLMISAARRFHEGRLKIDSSTWENYHINWMWGQEIREAVVGFYGFGGIGQTIAKRLKGFDIGKILYTTRKRVDSDIEKEFSASKVPFDKLLAESDILFLAAPLSNETFGVFNSSAFAKMKPSAVLVNVARGQLINQEDLYKALKDNQIFAAGLDVTTPEPLPANHPLLSLPNCVVTPHLGSATERTRSDMATIAAHNVIRGMVGEPMFAPAY